MDDQQSPAMGTPAPGTVPAAEDTYTPTPAANPEEGVGSQAAAEVNPNSQRNSPETAAAEAAEPAQAETPTAEPAAEPPAEPAAASQDAGEGEAEATAEPAAASQDAGEGEAEPAESAPEPAAASA